MINASLAMAGLLVGFIIIELMVRPHQAQFVNFILQDRPPLIEAFYKRLYRYDPRFGWLPLSNVSVKEWSGRASTLDDGFRSNGKQSNIKNGISILALGDSFTFGDDVSDTDTWPAFLEQLTRFKVYNAGVSSYGIDQTILRLEEENLIKKYDPRIIILSIVGDDVHRCIETVRHGAPKPYFKLENDHLILQKQLPFDKGMDVFRKILGHSYVCHRIMSSMFPSYWWRGTRREFRSVEGNDLEISELLFDRFMKSAQGRDVVFLIQGVAGEGIDQEQQEDITPLIEYVKYNYPKVQVINLVPQLVQLSNKNPSKYKSFFFGYHMTPEGNKFVAQSLAQDIIKFRGLSMRTPGKTGQ